MQDILTLNFAVDRTGNEILKATREWAVAAGLKPSVYTHPIDYHGHVVGTNIVLWDYIRKGVPGMGDVAMHANTAYSVELNMRVSAPEWDNKEIRIVLEENGYFDGKKHTYIGGRQTEFHLIGQ